MSDIDDFDEDLETDDYSSDYEDTQTASMFGDDVEKEITPDFEPNPLWAEDNKTTKPYLVLARKYRPQRFEDLIGQEAMVRTLTNAFKQNRIAHAFMLTGVRGVGKTTTARLIARALNYESPEVHKPSMELDILGSHCESIMQGRHPDVLELDAASRSGVENMRELLDNVRYGPTSARYKVYIIDEVHMLSNAAFNALLKTLEEPPPHSKFIFATTENRKVPVTILSRCQRFDLRRIENTVLANHLENICGKENVSIEREGLELIARAAEGSVRDSLSLLDQAMVQDEIDIISAENIRQMLGLSDRNRIYALFEHLLNANAKAALLEIKDQYDYGAEPSYILQSLMDLSHELSKLLILGADYKIIEKGDNLVRLQNLAEKSSSLLLSRVWQMLLKGLEEVKIAPDPIQAVDMCILRICGAGSVPPPEDLVKMLSSGKFEGGANPSAASVSSGGTSAAYREFNDFESVLNALEHEKGEMALVSDLERYAMPISVVSGKIVFEPIQTAPKNLGLRLAKAMQELTFYEWKVHLESGGTETIFSKREALRLKRIEEVKQLEAVKKLLKAFPGARIDKILTPSNDSKFSERKLEK